MEKAQKGLLSENTLKKQQSVVIKEELIRPGPYPFETYRNIDVYRAAVEPGMTTPE